MKVSIIKRTTAPDTFLVGEDSDLVIECGKLTLVIFSEEDGEIMIKMRTPYELERTSEQGGSFSTESLCFIRDKEHAQSLGKFMPSERIDVK